MSDPYTQPDLTDIYKAIARFASSITGVRSGVYPPPGRLPLAPGLIVFGGSGSVTHGPDQMWELRPKAHLMVAATGATEAEISQADKLLMPLVDAFSADNEETDGFTLGGLVDRCVVADWGELSLLGYGGHDYLGYQVYFDVKHHRSAGGYQ